MDNFRITRHRACHVIRLPESTMRYVKRTRDDQPVRLRIRELAFSRVRYGQERIHALLRREGWLVNHKRVRRIYREEGLNLRIRRPRRSRSAAHRLARPELTPETKIWSMDFVHDQLFDGRRFRVLIPAEPGSIITVAFAWLSRPPEPSPRWAWWKYWKTSGQTITSCPREYR